jgi:hypothetical protein
MRYNTVYLSMKYLSNRRRDICGNQELSFLKLKIVSALNFDDVTNFEHTHNSLIQLKLNWLINILVQAALHFLYAPSALSSILPWFLGIKMATSHYTWKWLVVTTASGLNEERHRFLKECCADNDTKYLIF